MNHRIIEVYEGHTKGRIGRREFLRRLAQLAGGAAAAYGLLAQLESDCAIAEVVPKDDPRLHTEYIKYPGQTGEVRASLARPKGDAKLPCVIVIHENRGLTPHIEDVTRRVALQGYLAIAPDALSPLGGTPDDPDEARSRIGKLDSEATVKNFVAAVKYLKTHPQSTGKVGCMGLRAAVPFYGSQPASEDVPKIKASMLIHYAGLDTRINAGIEAFETALKKASVDYKIYMYEGAGHAFFNDTNESRYHKEAAELAWKRTVEFFNQKLKT
jgi:carboxymethylenebutenolidase